MKVSEYRQMMAYLTRPAFNGGGSVKNKTVLPKKKPEEEVKKRKIKNFEKAKPALENPKEVKEMIDKPKRGLVDEPGSYAGEQAKGIYTLNELANLETNPYGPDAFKSFVRGGSGKSKKDIKKFLEMLKESGADLLPRTEKGDYKFKIKNIDKAMDGVTKFALASPKSKPRKFTQRYYEEVPKTFKELVKKGEPFSKEDLKRKVLLNLKDFPYQMKDTALDDVITRTISKKEQKKFTYGGDLKSLKVTKGKQNIYENVLKGNTNIKNLIKATGQTKKEIERNVKNLMYSLYETRGAIGAKEDLSNLDRKNKINVFLRNESLENVEKAISNIIDEPTLKTSYRDTFNNIVYDAIGNPKNKETYQPKKYKRTMERLRAFYSLNDELSKKFPQFDLRLDHGLSRAAIKTVLGEGDKTKFLNVAPLTEEINAGLKKAFDVQYKTILENIQDDSKRADRTKFLKQKVALEKLAKDIKLPFGTISPGGKKKFTSGTLEQQDLPTNIKKAITIKNNIIENIKKIPDLEQQFKIAFEGTKTNALETLNNLKKDKNIPRVLNFLEMLIKKRPSLRAAIPEGSFDFLNKISDAIVSPVAAAEVLPGEAQAAPPKPKEPMSFDLDMSLPPKQESIFKNPYVSGAAGATVGLSIPKTRPLTKKLLGIGFRGLGTAPVLLGETIRQIPEADYSKFSSRIFPELTAAFAKDAVSLGQGLAKQFGKGIQSLTPFNTPQPGARKLAQRLLLSSPRFIKAARVLSPIGQLALLGEGALGYGKFVKSELDRIKAMTPEQREQYNAAEQEQMGIAAAGGGLLKQAGDRSGKPPEAGPTPQGLDFLMKRGR